MKTIRLFVTRHPTDFLPLGRNASPLLRRVHSHLLSPSSPTIFSMRKVLHGFKYQEKVWAYYCFSDDR